MNERTIGGLIKDGRPLFLPSLSSDQLYEVISPEYRHTLSDCPVDGLMIVPLKADGNISGTITVAKNGRDRMYTDEDLSILQDIAEKASIAIENFRMSLSIQKELYESRMIEGMLRESERLAKTLNEINNAMISVMDIKEVMKRVLTDATLAIGADKAGISIKEDDRWVIKHVYCLPDELRGARFTADEAKAMTMIAATGKPGIFIDAKSDDRTNTRIAMRYNYSSAIAMPLFIKGDVIGIIGFFNSEVRPFTELQIDFAGKLAASVSLVISNAQLYKQLQDAKDQTELYMGFVGHDINNMNAAGTTYLKMAQDVLDKDGFIDHKNAHLINRPYEVLMNGSKLIRTVSALNMIKTGDVYDTIIDLGFVLQQVSDRYVSIPGKQVMIDYAHRPGCFVLANDLIWRAFDNIIDNAVKHSGNVDQVNISVILTDVEADSKKYHCVSIIDDGPGIPDNEKVKLFRRFQRGPSRAEGSGLGLYLVKTLIECYHGKVWIEDRVPGDYTKGSKFVILLPAFE